MKALPSRFCKDESGATAIEYALIASLISIVIVGALTTMGTSLKAKFNQVAVQLQ
jgi:pilus assembly protein Flp/PilA